MKMTPCAFSYDVLVAYTDGEMTRWREWFRDHPAALNVPFGEGMLATVGDLIAHTFSVELRHTQRLLGRPVTPPETITPKTFDEIFALGDQARTLVKEFLASATPDTWQETLTFPTMTAGMVTATKHKMASNLFLHATRHWAQVATAVRRAGFADQWPHDLLLSAAMA
jgi:uncharacterized damage-inducible protein DinB